jgi:oxygen-dependent protoporphyrinogen oxidase
LGGIYAAKSHNLSLAATFPQLIQMEKKHGSLIRGFRQAAKQHASKGSKSIFYSLKRGMGSLIEALQKKIPQDSIHLNQKVMRIEKEEQGYKVYLESGKTLRTQNLILAIPPPTIASLFPKTSNLQKAISPFLCSSTATVFLAFPKKAIALKYDGLGFVCTRTLDHKILACTWASNKFSFRSPEDIFLMRCFLGGEGKEEVIDQSEEEMVKICQGELKNLMNIQADPLFSRVYKWSKRSPRYGVGQLERLKKLEESLRDYPNLHIIGNAYRGVGIPDCIRMAKECTEKLSSPTNS